MGKFNCEACKKKCKKEAIRLQDKYFHVTCFTCKECQKQLAMDGFYAKDGNHYCAEDYQRLFGSKCRACGKVAEGEVMTVLGNTYHQDCFCCSKCSKKFQPGEKVTFSHDEHLCHGCLKLEPNLRAVSRDDGSYAASSVTKSDTALFDSSVSAASQSGDVGIRSAHLNRLSTSQSADRSDLDATTDMQNGITSKEQNRSSTDLEASTSIPVRNAKSTSSLPRVFGMPENKFYNISYLERTGNDFRRGPTDSLNVVEPKTHYHRPENFSYTNLRRDFKPEKHERGTKKELVHLSKRPDAQEKGLAPIERDDWPGPPEPAAAYPELLREKEFRKKSEGSGVVGGEEEKVSKEIEELSKMRDSGAAAVILKDLKKKRAESPTLDPRNASRTPSAAVEPLHKPRYETPYFASPSRDLDKCRPSRSRSTDNSMARSALGPRHIYAAPRPGYGLSPNRAVSSMEARNYYYSSDGVEVDFPRRPQSSGGILQDSIPAVVGHLASEDEYDPNTGLRRSTPYLRSATLPVGMTGFTSVFDSYRLPVGHKPDEGFKTYPYEQLKTETGRQLPGIDKDALERHLSKEEFEVVFQMRQEEFYRQPAWKRNDAKTRVGLY